MSQNDAPNFRRVDTCFYCKYLTPNNIRSEDRCEKYEFDLEPKQAHVYKCESWKHWKEDE